MGLHREPDDTQYFSDLNYEEDKEELDYKKQIRRKLEERLEQKRLKEELCDEFNEDFDWSELDK